MTSVVRLLEYALGAVLFCVGILLLFHSYSSMNAAIRSLERSKEKNIVYEQGGFRKEDIVTYAQLAAGFFEPLEYDIRIDDKTYEKGACDIESIRELDSRCSYYCSYEYDDTGRLTCICYEEMKN